jgi:hypothetical protein
MDLSQGWLLRALAAGISQGEGSEEREQEKAGKMKVTVIL